MYWDSVSEGNFNIPQDGNRNQFFKLGDKVVFPVEQNSGTTPTTVGGLQNLQPLAVFNTATGQFGNTNTNWTGDPVNPMYLHQSSNPETFFIFDSIKIYRAVIKNDSVVYTQIQNQVNRNYYGYHESGNNIYIFGYKYVMVLDKAGNLIKEIDVNYGSGGSTLRDLYTVSEYQNQIYLGFENAGAGMGILNPNTGEVSIDRSVSQHGGCKIRLIGDSLYMATTSMDFHKFSSTLYKMRNGKWTPIIAGSKLPELHNEKWYVRITDNDAYYIASKEALGVKENFYEFTPNVDSVIPKTIIYPIRDPRADTIDFWNNYYHRFQDRHGLGIVPVIDYVFENTTGAVYGFGNNFVAKLTPHSTGTGFNKKLTLPKVTIYPNPASEKITIAGLIKETLVNVTNLDGQTVFSVLSTGEVDISTLTPGLYFVNISGFTTGKFMKK